MIVSLITVVFNCEDYIEACLASVYAQTYPKIEHIIVDGKSIDRTLDIIKQKASKQAILISESDLGYYDALNKGIKLATGSIVGVLNADDVFANIHVIDTVVSCFKAKQCQAVYGNLNYIKRATVETLSRKWRDHSYNVNRFQYGWMPPHPTLFFKRELFTLLGFYSLQFDSCADYDLIIRFLYFGRVKTHFLNEDMVSMRTGGMSNGSLSKTMNGIKQDYRVLISNDFYFCWGVVFLKRFRKLGQFIRI